MRILESELFMDPQAFLHGDSVKHTKKTYKEVKDLYKDIDPSLSDDTIVYEVYTISETKPSLGSLCWGLSVLHPLTIVGEYNMTKGHVHRETSCNEFYTGVAGEGLLLLKDEDGKTYAEKVHPGSLHHIRGFQAHRLVNTGNTDLKVLCAWSSQAGHDYKALENDPFSARIYNDHGQIRIEEIL